MKTSILMLSGLCLTLWLHCLWAANGLDAWTLRTNSVSNTNSLFSITYANNKFVAVGGDPAPGWEGRGVIVTSMDGSLWTQPRVSLGTLLHVTYGGGLFLAGPKAPGGIFNSRDGYSWASSLSGIRAGGGVAYGNFMFLAASGADVYTSTNALTWTRTTIPGFELSFRDLAFGNGQFVAAGGMHRSGLMTSTDGTAWRGVSSSAEVTGISYGAGGFVAVGYRGKMMTSFDATIWIARDTGTTNNLQGSGYGGGVYVAVGSRGTILTSTDATTWTPRVSGVTNDLIGVAYGNGRFVVVGANATILESGPVTHLGRIQPLSNGAVQFTLSGPAGQVLELQTSTHLNNWVALTGVTQAESSTAFVVVSPTNFTQRFFRVFAP